jgi:cell division protein FtsI (penicillin-binding protein 3)
VSTSTRPPRGPIKWLDQGSGDGPRTYTRGDPSKRLRVFGLIAAFVLTVFGARLVDLQLLNSAPRAEEALKGRTEVVSLPAPRGTIYDANMNVLAESIVAIDVTADPQLVVDKQATAEYLSPILGLPEAQIIDSLTTDKKFAYIARQVSQETWDAVEALDLRGIFSDRTYKRFYPSGELGANVIGYVREDGEPGAGLEYGLDAELRGTDGEKIFERGIGGRQIPTGLKREREPVAGTSVQLTIDRDLQWVAQQAIAKRVEEVQADSGTVVVIDPRTGEIKALASVPTMDPNNPGEADDDNRNNRAVTEVFEPGSTSKVITMAAVLNEKAATPRSVFTVPYSFTRGGTVFKNHDTHPTYQLTLAGILAKSANTGTIEAAELIGGETLFDYIKKFGIGEPTGLQFPGESDGYVPPPSEWSPTSFPTISFGQGLSVNAIQATSVFATIANGGVRMPSTLIKGYMSPEGARQAAAQPEGVRVVDEKAARQTMRMMEQVVGEEGTARMASIPGYRVAGKTGTAYRINDACGCYDNSVTASFIGVAPADDPRLVVGVIVQNPKASRYGGLTGGPVFREVMVHGLQSLTIPPSGTKSPQMPIYSSDLGG